MATVGPVIGNDLLLYIGEDAIACTTDASFDFSRTEFSVTCKDNDGAEQIRLGGTTGTFTVSGIWKFDAAYGVEDLMDAFLAKTTLVAMWSTEETGDFYLSANVYITNISGSSPVNDAVTFDATFKISGPITKAPVAA